MSGNNFSENVLASFLEAAVLIHQQDLLIKNGPDDQDIKRAVDFGKVLAEEGDKLLYKSKKTAEMFNQTAFAVAVLSFFPGGVTLFNKTFDANKFLENKKQ